MSQAGLYVVATPIGNLEDISFRAVRILSEVDLIAAEDTRHSRVLLSHYNIMTSMQALHEHNEAQLVDRILDRISDGQAIALISDAGTPLISDPGYRLVKAARGSRPGSLFCSRSQCDYRCIVCCRPTAGPFCV